MRYIRPTFLTLVFLLAGLTACDRSPQPDAPPAPLDKELPRERIVLTSAIRVVPTENSVTLPLHRGRAGMQTVWYILTDSSDAADARQRGLVHAPLLARAGHVQIVQQTAGGLVFAAAPDFSPARLYRGGTQGFPPQSFAAGATAPAAYSPFIRLHDGGPVLNAPIVAVGDGPFDLARHDSTLDRVLAIDTARREVTLLLSRGFAEGRAVLYISTEASDPLAAALERAIWVPRLGEGDGDIGLIALVNGQVGSANPEAQGLRHLALDGAIDAEAGLHNAARLGAPGNILTAFPTGKTASGYSPLWSVSFGVWSDAAIARRLSHQAEIYRRLGRDIGGPDGASFQPSGITVNCPVIAYLDDAPP